MYLFNYFLKFLSNLFVIVLFNINFVNYYAFVKDAQYLTIQSYRI